MRLQNFIWLAGPARRCVLWYRENEDDDEYVEYRQDRARRARMFNRAACMGIDPVDLDEDECADDYCEDDE